MEIAVVVVVVVTTFVMLFVDACHSDPCDTLQVVKEKQESAAVKAKEAQIIADDAQSDLNEALPALEAALESLKLLSKSDVVEVRALQRPPDGVRLVIEAVCIMKSVKPKKVPNEKVRQ